MAVDCVTCVFMDPLLMEGPAYARAVFDGVIPHARKIFNSAVGLWVVFWLIRVMLSGNSPPWKDFVVTTIVILAARAFLEANALYWEWVYDPATTALSGLAQNAVSPQGAMNDPTLSGLVKTVESKLWVGIDLSNAILKDASFHRVDLMVLGAFLVVPLIFLLLFFCFHLAASIFVFIGVSGIAPILICLSAWKGTRGIAIGGVRLLISNICVVFFAAMAMGLTIFAIDKVVATLPINASGIVVVDAAKFVYSKDYWAVLFTALMGVLFQHKAAEIASAIGGTFVGGTAPAIAGAVGAAAMFFGGRAAMNAPQGLGKGIQAAKAGAEHVASGSSKLAEMLNLRGGK